MKEVASAIAACLVCYLLAAIASGISFTLLHTISSVAIGSDDAFSRMLDQPELGSQIGAVFKFAAVASIAIAITAFIPAMLTLTLLWAVSARGPIAHALAGILVSGMGHEIASNIGPSDFTWPLASAGAAGGLVFWMLFHKLGRDAAKRRAYN